MVRYGNDGSTSPSRSNGFYYRITMFQVCSPDDSIGDSRHRLRRYSTNHVRPTRLGGIMSTSQSEFYESDRVEAARERFQSCLALATYVVKKFTIPQHYEDAKQEALLALHVSSIKFKPECGSFSNYAFHNMRNAVRRLNLKMWKHEGQFRLNELDHDILPAEIIEPDYSEFIVEVLSLTRDPLVREYIQRKIILDQSTLSIIADLGITRAEFKAIQMRFQRFAVRCRTHLQITSKF